MATAEHMKLVFRLGAVRFSLPVDHLVEIIQGSAGWLDRSRGEAPVGCLGSINQRDGVLEVFDLGACLHLSPWSENGEMSVLVLSGTHGNWAVPVDEVIGIFPNEDFSSLTVSPLLEQLCPSPVPQFELWQDQVLVCGDAGRWEQLHA